MTTASRASAASKPRPRTRERQAGVLGRSKLTGQLVFAPVRKRKSAITVSSVRRALEALRKRPQG